MISRKFLWCCRWGTVFCVISTLETCTESMWWCLLQTALSCHLVLAMKMVQHLQLTTWQHTFVCLTLATCVLGRASSYHPVQVSSTPQLLKYPWHISWIIRLFSCRCVFHIKQNYLSMKRIKQTAIISKKFLCYQYHTTFYLVLFCLGSYNMWMKLFIIITVDSIAIGHLFFIHSTGWRWADWHISNGHR